MSTARHPWWMAPAALAGAWLVRLLGWTWRIEWVGIAGREPHLRPGQRCVLAFWHARLLPLCFTHRGRGMAVLVSRHRDGELIARIVQHLGFMTARGSSTRGGEEGVRDMLRLAEQGRVIGISPDGPRGPAEVVKPGVVYLAARAGVPVIPVAAAAARAWRLRSWDRFVIPVPFSKVVVGYGLPLDIPARLEEPESEAWRVRLEHALTALTRDLEQSAGSRS